MLTQDDVINLLEYDIDTGIFVWRRRSESHFKSTRAGRTWNTRYSGSKAGTLRKSARRVTPYSAIMLNGKSHYAHRLAWLYVFGVMPEKQLDHIDGNGLNNAISNLRIVTQSENSRNSRRSSKNTTGVTGVYYDQSSDKWMAFIGIGGKSSKKLGRFSSFEDAVMARSDAEKKYGYHSNHGR